MTEDGTVRRILRNCATWAVVGLGDNPARPAYQVAAFLQARGKRVVPVHPWVERVLGEPAYHTLGEVPFPVDCVDVFRRSAAAGAVADAAVAIGARAVWFQLGVVDEAAAARVRRPGSTWSPTAARSWSGRGSGRG